MERNLVELWKQRSAFISATVKEVASLDEAFAYVLDLCRDAPHHEDLMAPVVACAEDSPCAAAAAGATAPGKPNALAAPGFPPAQSEALRKGCEERGLVFVDKNLREYAAGLEVGVAWSLAALADTGSCILNSTNEDERLATMLPETCVLLVPQSKILSGSNEAAPLLRRLMEGDKPSFIAYVGGPSRTADIERVLTLGVHGPLYLHAVLIPDEALA